MYCYVRCVVLFVDSYVVGCYIKKLLLFGLLCNIVVVACRYICCCCVWVLYVVICVVEFVVATVTVVCVGILVFVAN